ncbi:transposase [Dictyobacter sp. S3.2.2.5]|uniref:Transposase n=1 Tax=Dictyobacter halimunensis TaxID=3026934 RepID=A0ABQ6FNU7_9CHLR|nr:transposase [Dictyobacter sp. S3.2.2.5]
MAATMIKAHKIRLHPTPEQEDYLRRAAGTRRFVYNWGLAEWNKQYAEYKEGKREKKPTANALKKHFQAIREKDFPWTFEVTKCVIEGAFEDLGDAFSRFFKGQNDHPTFKKKNKSRESFYVANDKFSVGDHWIVVPVLGQFLLDKQQADGTLPQKIRNKTKYKRGLGKVNMAESLRFVVADSSQKAGTWRNEKKKVLCSSVKMVGATIGLSGGYWYVSIHVEVPAISVINTHPIVGVDVGIKEAAIVSDGRRFENQKPLARQIKKLKRLSRSLSRKQYDQESKQGSKNREKARVKLARLHGQLANIRRDSQHKLTTEMARTCSVVGLEDLHVKGLLKNRKLARTMADAGLGQLLQFFETKMQAVGGQAIVVDRFFPSTKRCSGCGHVKKRMPLKYRTYCCLKCGLVRTAT